MEKTAMQRLKNHLQADVELSFLKQKDVDRISWYIDKFFIDFEKKDIINAFEEGCFHGSEAHTSTYKNKEDYYSKTYIQ